MRCALYLTFICFSLNPLLPLGVLVRVVPRIGRRRAVAIIRRVVIRGRTAPTARRVLASGVRLVVGRLCGFGGLGGFIGPSRRTHVLGEYLLAGDTRVVVGGVAHVVIHHLSRIVEFN